MMDIDVLRRLAGQDISIELYDGVLILHFGHNVFPFLTALEKREHYFKIMDAADNADDVKVVLSLAGPDSLGDEIYDGYLRKICGKGSDAGNLGDSWDFKENTDYLRQLCFHRYTIERRVASKKIIIDGRLCSD